MKRTNAFGSVANKFSNGNPATSTPATIVEQTWLNNVQEELCNFIESQGITLDGGDEEQLIQALNLFVGAIGNNFGQDFGTTAGLNFGIKSGILRRENALIALSADVIALTDDATNNVYLDTTTSSESIEVIVGAVPVQAIPLYQIITVSGEITLITDQKTQIIDVDSLHEADQVDVGDRTFAADKKAALKASGASATTLLTLENSVGLIGSLKTSSSNFYASIGQAGGMFVVTNAAGSIEALRVKDDGLLSGAVPAGLLTAATLGICIDSLGAIRSAKQSSGDSHHNFYSAVAAGLAGSIKNSGAGIAYNTTSDPERKIEEAKLLEKLNLYEQWAKLQKCLYGFYWKDKDGNPDLEQGPQIGYNARAACEEDLQCGLGTPRASGTWDYKIGEKYGTEIVDVEVKKLNEDGTPFLDDDGKEVWEVKKKEVDLIEEPASVDQGKPTSLIAAMLEQTRKEFDEYKLQIADQIGDLIERLEVLGNK